MSQNECEKVCAFCGRPISGDAVTKSDSTGIQLTYHVQCAQWEREANCAICGGLLLMHNPNKITTGDWGEETVYHKHCWQEALARKKAEQKRREEAKEKARQLLTLPENAVRFKRVLTDEDDDAKPYTTVVPRLPKEHFITLLKAGAVRSFTDEMGAKHWDFDVSKATPILQKLGYVVVTPEEWEQRKEQAKQILREAGIAEWELRNFEWEFRYEP